MSQYYCTLQYDLDEIKKLHYFVRKISKIHQLKNKTTSLIQLTLEELITNIIFYGSNINEQQSIQLKIHIQKNQMTLFVSDQSKPFNPLKKFEKKVTKKNLLNRREGGFGILLIKKFMDHISYRYHEGGNHLTLVKSIP